MALSAGLVPRRFLCLLPHPSLVGVGLFDDDLEYLAKDLCGIRLLVVVQLLHFELLYDVAQHGE